MKCRVTNEKVRSWCDGSDIKEWYQRLNQMFGKSSWWGCLYMYVWMNEGMFVMIIYVWIGEFVFECWCCWIEFWYVRRMEEKNSGRTLGVHLYPHISPAKLLAVGKASCRWVWKQAIEYNLEVERKTMPTARLGLIPSLEVFPFVITPLVIAQASARSDINTD